MVARQVSDVACMGYSGHRASSTGGAKRLTASPSTRLAVSAMNGQSLLRHIAVSQPKRDLSG
ncbi:MAG: hypothetical protein Q8J76_01190 [Desulfobulbaceae bacterium]|nr:hypothetical protein [Desulfobulbaceae bacterium]